MRVRVLAALVVAVLIGSGCDDNPGRGAGCPSGNALDVDVEGRELLADGWDANGDGVICVPSADYPSVVEAFPHPGPAVVYPTVGG